MRHIVRVVANQTVQGDKAVAEDQETLKKLILEALQAEIEMQKTWDEIAKGVYAIEFASDVQEPPRSELETLLRYRAANTRELKDLLESLERIRRLRQSAA